MKPQTGSLLGTFVTSSDVRAMKEKLNPQVIALNEVYKACPTLDTKTGQLWQAYVDGWNSFYKADDGFFTAGAEYDFALAQEQELNGWRVVAAQQCKTVVGPSNTTPGSVPTNPPLPTVDGSTKLLIGGGIAAVLLLLLKK